MAGEKPVGFLALLRAGDVRGALTHHADLALAALVVSIVGMMIIPLPTLLLDILISLNIAIAVTLLLITIYVADALRIATFPTLLLLTTLFRLAIEISATRLILLRADAGEVIRAFGNFVVAGNLVVGAIIFLILTVVQFLVVAKGSERVAEVAARFTLDAMPGKQMSIDAELRSGHIDHAEARRRRAAMARESQLYGSMDGAMKFVKGDAIAGIIVLAVNIVGGLIIGILQRGMEPAAAARTYTILTIGEGLVAQIPALIISTAAGIIVTRVASEDEGSHLGREIGRQVLAQPRALGIAAGLLGLLALVPGLPLVPFLLLAVVFGLVAWKLREPPRPTAAIDGVAPADDKSRAAAGKVAPVGPSPTLTPIAIDLGAGLSSEIAPDGGSGRLMKDLMPALRNRIFQETGISMPAVRVRVGAPGLPPRGYAIRLNEVPMARGEAPAPADGVAATHATEDRIAAHLHDVFCRYGYEFVGIQETQALLDGLERTHPALVREVVPKLCPPALLTDVLRRLAEEGVSLRALREILEALAQWAPSERDPVALTEHVRAALRRSLTHKHAPGGALSAFLLDPMIEETIRESIQHTPSGSYLALEPDLSRDILRAIGAEVGAAAATPGAAPVLLTNAEIRRYVRRLVEIDHPKLAVLSYQELAPETQIKPVGRIRVG